MNLKDQAKKSLKQHWEGAAVLIIASYFLSMVIIPIFITIYQVFPNLSFSVIWWSIQSVWDRWQTFNAAILALIASVIAFKATTYHDHREQENNFRAAKSQLPQALSDICSYLGRCAQIHYQHYGRIKLGEERVQAPVPARPLEAVASIVECIRYSPVEVGDYLSKILESLQVIHARLAPDSHGVIYVGILANEISYIKYIARAYKRSENLFGYARNEQPFKLADESIEALNKTIRAHFLILDPDIAQPE